MAVYTNRNKKPPYNARINPTHPIGAKLLQGMCVPFLGPGGPLRDVVSGISVKLENAGFIGFPALNWAPCISTSGNVAYMGHPDDYCVASGWLDRTLILVQPPSRTYTVILGTTNANITAAYGNQNVTVTPTGGIITAAVFQTQLLTLTNIGAGNVTVTGPNNGPFTVTITSPAVWPADFQAVGAANCCTQTNLNNAFMKIAWSPQQIQRWYTVPPGGCWAAWKVKVINTSVTQGQIRSGDTRSGLPFGFYLGVSAGDFAIPYNTSSLQEIAINANDWLDLIVSWGATTVDYWIGGVHQTQITSASLANQWSNQIIKTGAPVSSQEMAINATLNGPGTTLQGRGTPSGQINNMAYSFFAFGYNSQITDADVQRWYNMGQWSFLYPNRVSLFLSADFFTSSSSSFSSLSSQASLFSSSSSPSLIASSSSPASSASSASSPSSSSSPSLFSSPSSSSPSPSASPSSSSSPSPSHSSSLSSLFSLMSSSSGSQASHSLSALLFLLQAKGLHYTNPTSADFSAKDLEFND